MTVHKFTNFGKFFKMHADVTAVIIQSNKTVSNLKTTKHYLNHHMEKN